MADETTRAQKAAAEALIPRFVFERLLNQGVCDSRGVNIALRARVFVVSKEGESDRDNVSGEEAMQCFVVTVHPAH